MKLLLDHIADVNASRHTDGATPLYIAARSGHTEVVKLLLDKNADTSKSAKPGGKPIDAARRNCYLDIVKLLL